MAKVMLNEGEILKQLSLANSNWEELPINQEPICTK